jgi:predicted dehydrogenase
VTNAPGTSLRPLGVAVVGTGQISRFIASDLRLVDGARLRAVASRSLDRAAAFADELGFERHGQFEAVLSDDEVDLVYIATPHATHAELAVRALEAGKHVLVEKPLAVSPAEAQRVAEASERADRFAMEAMWMKFNPAYDQFLREALEGSIGRVGSVRASFGLPFGPVESDRWSAELCSSTLLDQAIYPVTVADALFGPPIRIRAAATLRPDGVDVTVHATLEHDGGRFAQIAGSMVTYIEPTATINGADGWLTMHAPFWASTRYDRHVGAIPEALLSPTSVDVEREGFGYVPMLRSALAAIRDGARSHSVHTLEDSIRVLTTLDRIRAAWRDEATSTVRAEPETR